MSDKRTASGGGIGFCGTLFLLFLGLQLTENINWEWYWVASPLWMPLAVVIGGVLFVCTFVVPIKWMLDRRRTAKAQATRRNKHGVPKL